MSGMSMTLYEHAANSRETPKVRTLLIIIQQTSSSRVQHKDADIAATNKRTHHRHLNNVRCMHNGANTSVVYRVSRCIPYPCQLP